MDDTETRITESLEEQGTSSVQVAAGALGGGATATLLGNSTTQVPGHGIRRICRVRTAGADPNAPAAKLVDATPCTDGAATIPGNVIVLDGDFDQNGADAGDAHHLLYANATGGARITSATVVDGFTIRIGAGEFGAFSCTASGVGSECSPTMRNLVFSDNYGAAYLVAANGGTASRAPERPCMQMEGGSTSPTASSGTTPRVPREGPSTPAGRPSFS